MPYTQYHLYTTHTNHPDNGTLSSEAGRMDQWRLRVPTAIAARSGSAVQQGDLSPARST